MVEDRLMHGITAPPWLHCQWNGWSRITAMASSHLPSHAPQTMRLSIPTMTWVSNPVPYGSSESRIRIFFLLFGEVAGGLQNPLICHAVFIKGDASSRCYWRGHLFTQHFFLRTATEDQSIRGDQWLPRIEKHNACLGATTGT